MSPVHVRTAAGTEDLCLPGVLTTEQIHHSAHYLLHSQESSGAIPWFPGGHTDVWDHVECAMALTVTGLAVPEHAEAARRAYLWLESMRRPAGRRDAKYCSYKPPISAHA